MYSHLPPPPPDVPVVFSTDPVIDTLDRVDALELAFTVLAVALVESGALQANHLKCQLWRVAAECDASTGGPTPRAAYLDQIVERLVGALPPSQPSVPASSSGAGSRR